MPPQHPCPGNRMQRKAQCPGFRCTRMIRAAVSPCAFYCGDGYVFWWMPYLPILDLLATDTDKKRQHAKTKVRPDNANKVDRPRAKAKTKRNAASKTTRRKGAARKS